MSDFELFFCCHGDIVCKHEFVCKFPAYSKPKAFSSSSQLRFRCTSMHLRWIIKTLWRIWMPLNQWIVEEEVTWHSASEGKTRADLRTPIFPTTNVSIESNIIITFTFNNNNSKLQVHCGSSFVRTAGSFFFFHLVDISFCCKTAVSFRFSADSFPLPKPRSQVRDQAGKPYCFPIAALWHCTNALGLKWLQKLLIPIMHCFFCF